MAINNWQDFYDEHKDNEHRDHLNPKLPLLGEQQDLNGLPSGILPSGEANFFYHGQHIDQKNTGDPRTMDFGGSGINFPFPYPNHLTHDLFKFEGSGFFHGNSFIRWSEDETANPAIYADFFSAEWWDVSGILKTFPEDRGGLQDFRVDKEPLETEYVGSGIFHPDELQNPFSNGPNSRASGIDDFTIFNPYIHHEKLPSTLALDKMVIRIPYISTYNISIDFNAYGTNVMGGSNGFNSGFINDGGV